MRKIFLSACCGLGLALVVTGCGGGSEATSEGAASSGAGSVVETSLAGETLEGIVDLSEQEYLDNAQYNYELIKAEIDKADPKAPVRDLTLQALKDLQPQLKQTAWDTYERSLVKAQDDILGKGADLQKAAEADKDKINARLAQEVPRAQNLVLTKKTFQEINRADGSRVLFSTDGNVEIHS